MNHVWAVTFKNAEAKKRILATPEIIVKGRRCIIIDPCNQDVRIKLHWLLFTVPDEDVRAALAPYGKVIEMTKEKWRVDGCAGVCTTTRNAVLRLKGGVTLDDIPHQLRVAGELVLVVVPGRAPLCLRCQQTGHIRRECRVPRCGVCRRFGHEGTHCSRSYAVAAAPGGSEDKSELLMDAAEAEEIAAVVAPEPALLADVGPKAPEETTAETTTLQTATPDSDATAPELDDAVLDTGDAQRGEQNNDAPESAEDAPMDVAGPSASGSTTKRQREEADADAETTGQDELPSKAAQGRRRRLFPKPNIPLDDRRVSKAPP